MDHDLELARFKWILIAGIAFLFSAYLSYKELKFAVWGETAEATVTDTHEVRGGRRSSPKLAVEYTFTDESGAHHSERDDVSINSAISTNDLLTVQYLPGVDDSSRIEGNSNRFAVVIFLGSLAWLAFSFFKLYRDAQNPHPYRRR